MSKWSHFKFASLTIGTLALLGALAIAAPVKAQILDEAEAFSISNGQTTEIVVGTIVGQATREGSRCVLATPITIGATVPDGASPLAITWRFTGRTVF